MNYIKAGLTDFFSAGYSQREWVCVKWTIMPLVLLIGSFAIVNFRGEVIHENICSYIDCTWVVRLPYLTIAVIWLLGLLYLFEIAMLITLPLLSVVCFFVFSYVESIGVKGEYGLFSLIYFAQFIAYLRHNRNSAGNLKTERMQFSIQLIAAAYVLSAISKLYVSGMQWFDENAMNFAVQIYREYSSGYASTGQPQFEADAMAYSSFMLRNVWLIKLLLVFSVLIEAGAFVLATGKKNAFFYAFLLIALHAGIYFSMNIILYTIIFSMLAFAINPVYHVVSLVLWIAQKMRGTRQF